MNNEGQGELDAAYNWWGDLDPSDSVSGEVDYRPFLPEEPCKFSDYMKKHDLEDPRAGVSGIMMNNASGSRKLVSRLITSFGLKPTRGEELVEKYGPYAIRIALRNAGNDYMEFIKELA